MAVSVEKRVFGKSKTGEDILLFTMKNRNGVEVSVMNLGGVLVSLKVPDAQGIVDDVVLGFDTGEEYYENGSFFGATVGPSANRIGGASFAIDGEEYHLPVNDNGNNLHSDFQKGYHLRMWNATDVEGGVSFDLTDEDGCMGFPGNKTLRVTYTLDDENRISIRYKGTSDKKTIFNPTNHSYFNLDGNQAGNIEGHSLLIYAEEFTPVARGGIPTGEVLPVAGTPMDFRREKVVGDDIDADYEQLRLTGGYDHNWIIPGADGTLKHIATVKAPKGRRTMQVYTTLPGVQFYTGNGMQPQAGKGGFVYERRSGLCLETQYFPDSIHHDNFPSYVFGPGRDYESETIYQFEIE